MHTQHLIASVVAACIALYLMAKREVNNGEFASLLVILIVLVIVVASNPARCERFVADQTTAIYAEVLRPKLDRLALAMGGERAVNAPRYKEDDMRTLKEASGTDIAKAIGNKSLKVANEFRLISAFLCNCAQSVDEAALLERVGVKPPVYTD